MTDLTTELTTATERRVYDLLVQTGSALTLADLTDVLTLAPEAVLGAIAALTADGAVWTEGNLVGAL